MTTRWQASNLSQINGIAHAFVANCGDLRGTPLLNRCGVAAGQDVFLDQQHTVAVLAANLQSAQPADGATTTGTERLWVRTADCLPVLLANGDGTRVAALHAGWKGILDEIVLRCIEIWIDTGESPRRITVAGGPHIRVQHFEVGPELAERFTRHAWSEGAIMQESGHTKPRIDLARCVRQQLKQAGVPDDRLEIMSPSTFDTPELASYRRDKETAGRNWAYIQRSPRGG